VSTDGPESPVSLNLARILHRLLTDPRGWRVDDLRAQLGIADRTYRKYRAVLQQHFDFLFDRDGRSQVIEVRDGDSRWLRLREPDEPAEGQVRFFARAAALQLAGQAFGFLDATPLGEDLDEFRRDFLDRSGDRTFVLGTLLRDLNRKLHHVQDAPKTYSGHAPVVATVLHALFWCRRVELEYEAERGPSGPKVIEPLTLVVWRSALYLVVRYRGGRKPYPLAVDRIRNARVLRETFRYPSREAYSPERLFEGSFGFFIDENAPTTDVELVFANERWLKLYLTERRWHPSQRFEDLPGGRLRMTLRVRGLRELWRWVHSFGDDVEVVRPCSALQGAAPE